MELSSANPPVPPGTIPVRGERQAMESSLVLLSQGIECIIESPNETHGWRLLIPATDYPRALRTLRQYRLENRRTLWVQELPWSGLVFDWRGGVWLAVLVLVFVCQTRSDAFRTAGAMDNIAVLSGEWWRLVSATTLHSDVGHLAANVTTGLLLLCLAMGSFGPGWGALGAFLAGVGGNLAGLIMYTHPYHGVGASGMVLGALGLVTGQSVSLLRTVQGGKEFAVRAACGGVLLLVLLGVNPGSDIIAHIGGFACGVLLGVALNFAPAKLLRNPWANGAATTLLVLLLTVSWWLALRNYTAAR